MKKVALCMSALALALLLAVVTSVGGGAYSTPVAFAQEGTPVPTVGAQVAPVQGTQPVEDDNNDFPWGILGLLGLAGLAGLRRRPETIQHEPGKVTPKVAVYDSKK